MNKLIAIALALITASTATHSYALDKPNGPVILTVQGDLSHPNSGKVAEFDLSMLEGLKGRTGKMKTPWNEGEVSYSGPLLRSILEAAGATGKTLKIIALNDYSATVPASDALDLDTILATRADGKTMSVRDKGPLFLIYPFDKDERLYNEKYFSRSVWQIAKIEVMN